MKVRIIIAMIVVGLTCAAAVLAPGVAFAAPRHRHHHHHHRGGGQSCGPGTAPDASGACVPSSTGPTGSPGVVFDPSDITMNLDGSFATSGMVTGVPPFGSGIVSIASLLTACSSATGFVVNGSAGALGHLVVSLSGVGCVPGTYPVLFEETSTPFQTLTGFITLHF